MFLLAQMFPGMEFIPLMLLLLGSGAIVCAVGILFGLLQASSTVAFRLGVAGVAIGVLGTLFFWLVVGENLTGTGYLMLFSPAVLGSAAVMLSYRRPFSRERIFVRTVGGIVIAVTVAGAAMLAWNSRQTAMGTAKLLSITSGANRYQLASMEVQYQQRRLICTDPVLLAEIQRHLAGAQRSMMGSGSTYETTFRLADGGSATLHSSWGANECSLSLGDVPEEGWPTHLIVFAEPLSEDLRKLLAFLNASNEEVAGQVLIFDGSGNRVEFDGTLVAH